MQAMNLKFRFSFIFKGFRTIHIPTEHPYSPSKCRFYSSRLPVYVLFILLCSSNLLRFTCLFHVSWKDYFLFMKSFKDSRLWHYLSFPQSTDYLEPQIVFAGQRSCCLPQDENMTELCAETRRQNLALKLLEIIHGRTFQLFFVLA